MKRRNFLAGGLALAASPAFGQTTVKPLRIVVPFPAGTPTDTVARLVADKLRGIYSPEVSVENIAGGGGRKGIEAVKNATADGATLLFTPDTPMTVYPHSVPKPGYDPLKDFAPIALVVRSPVVLAAGTALPMEVKSVKEFAAWAGANPQRASYTAQGSAQLAAALFAREAGVKLSRKDAREATVIFATLSDLLPDLRAGNVRALAVTGTRRAGLMPQVPTLAESGYPGVSIAPWLGFFAPAGTPADVIKRLVNGIADASAYGAVQQEFFKLGLDPVALTPAGFAGVLKSDLEAWGPLVKASGFTAED